MKIAEVIPIIQSLTHEEKFKLMHFLLEQIAAKEGVSLETPPPKKDDPLWSIVGMAEGEDAKVARNHDSFLYGAK